MERVKLAVLLSGGGTNLQAVLDQIDQGALSAEVVLIASNKEGAYGLTRGGQRGIPTAVFQRQSFPSKDQRDRELLRALKSSGADLVVLAGYLGQIPGFIIEAYPNQIINIHPSLLPCFGGKGYYGEKVHQGVYNRGMKVTGATVHFVSEETDGGPIILQEAVGIDFEDGVSDIQQKVLTLEHRLLPEAIELIAEGRVEVIGNRVKIRER
ncbi:phosphoribosylglycinamide formyltransferase [Isachenkonia alkalipeptolytica]|uniref:Phosphoribosylglycinamide formyltransferase n=1 Tax=Isachenkonia alkalipeptolytica TaxID=2565777 RepID=A0AA43XII7_9CLOT|nr:phosphoribosylglycinamide formyltransferase [Isachenkonia alkalipeptolytica]NBG87475.1 phosphoribosylglycinamide formyltransferase [Isachenkonia alkalipeptolytica]